MFMGDCLVCVIPQSIETLIVGHCYGPVPGQQRATIGAEPNKVGELVGAHTAPDTSTGFPAGEVDW
jgi:hypothetical protein